MIKAVIFDMDGVLVDSMPMHIKVWKEMFEKRRLEFNLKIFEKYNGISTKEISQILIEKYDLDDTVEDMIKEKHSKERILSKKMLNLFDHTIPTLKALKRKGYKIAIGTSALQETVDYMKKEFHIHKYVDAFDYSGEVLHTKPYPDIFLLAAKNLGVDPSECVVIEDALNGIEAAKRAGMIGIAITNTFPRESFEGIADFIIDDLDEIENIIGDY